MIKRFFELQEKILGYYADANLELLKKAYSFAANAHMNQMRASNEPYIIHPLAVAATLADMHLDEISIAAGLLHDIVEDTDYSIEEIQRQFGQEVSDIVWGVTKISKISEIDKENAQAETLKKMIVAMTQDVRVILIKLADRLHNIRTLDALPPEKQQRIARETLDIYAPIAYRLGMGKVKDELENVSFRYAFPEEYQRIHEEVDQKRVAAIARLNSVRDDIQRMLKRLGINGEIEYRIKREVSIHRKLVRQGISIERVYDLVALRVITGSVENCYALMGEIHQAWQHIPGRWRDFITNPKSNGYQSIHTTVLTPDGFKFEIQIRTREMHKVAEEGIAAHWKYKEGIAFLDSDQRLQWFRDMIETHRHNPDPREFITLVKKDLKPNEIYVFTPKGKVINLPAGATTVDFAYAIHSEIGERCRGAIVNEHLVPLRTELRSGDVVEILTGNTAAPSADWLKFVVSNRARRKISAFIQKRELGVFEEKGRRIWARSLREYRRRHKLKLSEAEVRERITRLNYSDPENFYRDLGSGRRVLDQRALRTLFPELRTKPPDAAVQKKVRQSSPAYRLVNVEGFQNIEVSFARCCRPIKGEEIIGYMTQKRGLVIHRRDCPNLRNAIPERLKQVNWNENDDFTYPVRYDLLVQNKPGLLSSISHITAQAESNIVRLESETLSQGLSRIRITFEVRDVAQLQKIIRKFQKTRGVFSVSRKRASEK